MLKHNNASKRFVNFIKISAIERSSEVCGFYQNIFDKCDADKDGYVSLLELKEFLTDIEEDEIPDEVVKKIFIHFDKNQDQKLNFQEFLILINNPTVLRTFKRVGSRYIKYIGVSRRTKSLTLKRTVSNTGKYDDEFTLNKYSVILAILSLLQIIMYYVIKAYKPVEYALRFDPCNRAEIWRFITYILVHSGPLHLYGNISLQILIGIPLELVHSWRVPVIYLVGAIGGSLASSVIDSTIKMGGASGAVYALITAHIATVLMNWQEMTHPYINLIIFGILATIEGILYIYGAMGPGISHVTHLFGAIFGLLMGIIILRNLKVTRFETIIWYACLTVFTIITIVLLIVNCVADVQHWECTKKIGT